MAEQLPQRERGVDLEHSQFLCSICLDLLKEPVAIPCGHNYCKGCIKGCWDQEEAKKGVYSCPQCRETFNPRPVLRRNNMLAEALEMLHISSTQQASPSAAAACAGPSDVACDFCSGTKPSKAAMSCLICLASYCSAHLEPHYTIPVLKKHQLVSATMSIEQKMCAKHNKLMEVYCQTDKTCICYLCVIDDHKNHCTVSAATERSVEQEQLIVNQKKVKEKCQGREKELNKLVQALKDFKSSSKRAVETSDEIFDKLITSIKQKRTFAKQLIETQEKIAVVQAEKLQLQLQEEITKLKRRDTDLEQLSHTDDHIHFIQTFKPLSCESPDLPLHPVVRSQRSFETVSDCMYKLRDEMETLMNHTWSHISATVSTVEVVLPPEPNTREFLHGQTSRRIILLGKNGVGKSSLANTICGDNLFKINHSCFSDMTHCHVETKHVNGRSITLIDIPGVFVTQRSEKMKPEILSCITKCAPGPHALLIVLKVQKFTVQDKDVNIIQEYFSEEAFKYAAVLFTHGDQLPEGKTIKDFVKESKVLSDLVAKCGSRCHVVDNKYWKNNGQDEYRSNQFQVEELLKTIDKMIEANNESYYTNKMLQEVNKKI